MCCATFKLGVPDLFIPCFGARVAEDIDLIHRESLLSLKQRKVTGMEELERKTQIVVSRWVDEPDEWVDEWSEDLDMWNRWPAMNECKDIRKEW